MAIAPTEHTRTLDHFRPSVSVVEIFVWNLQISIPRQLLLYSYVSPKTISYLFSLQVSPEDLHLSSSHPSQSHCEAGVSKWSPQLLRGSVPRPPAETVPFLRLR